LPTITPMRSLETNMSSSTRSGRRGLGVGVAVGPVVEGWGVGVAVPGRRVGAGGVWPGPSVAAGPGVGVSPGGGGGAGVSSTGSPLEGVAVLPGWLGVGEVRPGVPVVTGVRAFGVRVTVTVRETAVRVGVRRAVADSSPSRPQRPRTRAARPAPASRANSEPTSGQRRVTEGSPSHPFPGLLGQSPARSAEAYPATTCAA
jgi:hypothetical protein